ncbi:hypothetical protein ACJX0J_035527 [Zea mays]
MVVVSIDHDGHEKLAGFAATIKTQCILWFQLQTLTVLLSIDHDGHEKLVGFAATIKTQCILWFQLQTLTERAFILSTHLQDLIMQSISIDHDGHEKLAGFAATIKTQCILWFQLQTLTSIDHDGHEKLAGFAATIKTQCILWFQLQTLTECAFRAFILSTHLQDLIMQSISIDHDGHKKLAGFAATIKTQCILWFQLQTLTVLFFHFHVPKEHIQL